MFTLIFGVIAGMLAVYFARLQRKGTINLRWYQWLSLAILFVVVALFIDKYIGVELQIFDDTIMAVFETVLIPILLVALAIFLLPLYFKMKHRREEKKKEAEEQLTMNDGVAQQ